ncbi:cbb3-type cytochrome oxidase maturation protein [Salinisphaera sp. T5B8]|uniref:cbb3-type cytochrome oxidase assembly protein CcoS n=1 Tax=Salinisphaera sp. T5B8 TaxID=1304154 RepID=UPI00333EFB43
MTIVLVLLPLTLLLVGVAVWAFFWAVGDGQFDDMDSPAYRILLDDDDWPHAPEEHKRPPNARADADDAREQNEDRHSAEPPP